MQKKYTTTLFIIAVTIIFLVGCGNSKNINTEKAESELDNTVSEEVTQMESDEENNIESDLITETMTESMSEMETTTPETEQQSESHIHKYIDSVTTLATCEEPGVMTFVCACGDVYTEVIKAKGHSYGEYAYNNDATYTADGTKSAFCSSCGKEKRIVVEGTQKQGLYYTNENLNIKEAPSESSKVIDKISINTYVEVISEEKNGWVKIEYPDAYQNNQATGYVKKNQLSVDKTPTKEPAYGTVFYNNNEIDGYWEWIWIAPILHWDPEAKRMIDEDGNITYEGAWSGYSWYQNGFDKKHDEYEIYLIVSEVFAEYASSLEPPVDETTSIELDTIWIYMGDGISEES